MLRHWISALIIVSGLILAQPSPVSAYPPGDAAFREVWERNDRPISAQRVSRSWIWGPSAHSAPRMETYLDSPGGERKVQYFDKSRMEINDPQADQESPWYVTNGLLARELITGELQIGDDRFEVRQPANVQVAGDAHPDAPTFALLGQTRDRPGDPEGSLILSRLNSAGAIEVDAGLEAHAVAAEYYVDETDRTIASVFWAFMTSSGDIYDDGRYAHGQLFENPFFAVGFPITNAYWVHVPVAGHWQDVLVQCFERRCLTFTPNNPPGWQVEAGNIGQHYFLWRYGESPAQSPFAPAGTSPFLDGLHQVHTDIRPGIYFADIPSGLCYWQRIGTTAAGEPVVLEQRVGRDRMLAIVHPEDTAFSSDRCGRWTPVTRVVRSDTRAPIGPGMYLVGYELAAGIWQSVGDGSACYFRSISYRASERHSVVRTSFGDGGTAHRIERGDLAFASRNCGEWQRIEP